MQNSSKPRVCLVSPPSRSLNHFRPPLALLYLAGYLEKYGVSVTIVDVLLKDQIRTKAFNLSLKGQINLIKHALLKQIRQSQCNVVGITCYTPEYQEVLALAQKLKALDPKLTLVVGGIHPTFYPTDFIYDQSPVDFAIQGEGEQTFLDLVNHLGQPHAYPTIKGLAFFDSVHHQLIITPKRPVEPNLDKLAQPAYHLIDMAYYTSANPYLIRGVFTRGMYLLSSRGCPSQCTFCVSKQLQAYSGSAACTRHRSAGHLVSELKLLKANYQIDAFYFIDDLFTITKSHVQAFCRQLVKAKLNLIWGCSSKVNTVDLTTLKLMHQAGCVQIDFGVERGSDLALRQVKKGITLQMIKTTFGRCQTLGIRTFANMLINIPGESDQDLADIRNLLAEIQPTVVSTNIFTPYPGTEIYATQPHGITRADYPDLMKTHAWLFKYKPQKYRYAAHCQDLGLWAQATNHQFNRLWPALQFHLSPRYLTSLWRSDHKLNYFKMSGLVVKELLNQKFGL